MSIARIGEVALGILLAYGIIILARMIFASGGGI